MRHSARHVNAGYRSATRPATITERAGCTVIAPTVFRCGDYSSNRPSPVTISLHRGVAQMRKTLCDGDAAPDRRPPPTASSPAPDTTGGARARLGHPLRPAAASSSTPMPLTAFQHCIGHAALRREHPASPMAQQWVSITEAAITSTSIRRRATRPPSRNHPLPLSVHAAPNSLPPELPCRGDEPSTPLLWAASGSGVGGQAPQTTSCAHLNTRLPSLYSSITPVSADGVQYSATRAGGSCRLPSTQQNPGSGARKRTKTRCA